jgi:hypothetical protein
MIRALIGLSLAIGFAMPAASAERTIADFFGAYLGHGSEEPVAGPEHSETHRQTRFSQVIIKPAADNGFTIEWSTLKLKDDDIPSKADTKTHVETFRATDKPNVFRDVTPAEAGVFQDTAWAVINGDTLSIVKVVVASDGNYFVTHYDRTLSPQGMEARFTRFENSRIVRAVKLHLLKGPADVN